MYSDVLSWQSRRKEKEDAQNEIERNEGWCHVLIEEKKDFLMWRRQDCDSYNRAHSPPKLVRPSSKDERRQAIAMIEARNIKKIGAAGEKCEKHAVMTSLDIGEELQRRSLGMIIRAVH